MRRSSPFRLLLLACVAASLASSPATSVAQQPPSRQALPSRSAAPAGAPVVATLPADRALSFSVALPVRNRAQLEALLLAQRTPGSAHFGQFLSVQEFTDRFSPSSADYSAVIAYLQAHGMTITRTYPNRMLVNARGPVAAVNQTFQVTMRTYQHPTENRQFFAPDREPTVEPGLPILSVQGLSDYDRPHPMLKRAVAGAVRADTTGSGIGGQFLGSDMRAAYAGSTTLAGEGQSVGLVELGPYNISDVQSYFHNVNQPLKVPIYNVLLGVDGLCVGTPATGGCDDGEEVIDIQQAISMAPKLSALVVYEAYGGVDALAAFTQAANDNIAKQLSLSFGFGGTPATQPGYEQIFMELASQGQNLFIASGDGGAFPGTGGYPGNSPNVIDVGGTDLVTAGPGGPWQSESGWIGSGGGWNTASPIPAYQVPVINAANQGSPSFRNVPDLAMEANTDNYFCANGSCSGGIGGTSLAAPRWAGYLALANEQAAGRPVGFLNAIVYGIGQTSAYPSLFHDITTGDNFNAGSPTMFSAVPGYDLVTGWGTPDGQSLLDAFAPPSSTAPNFSLAASPDKISLTPGDTGTATISVTAVNGFAGRVDLSVLPIGAPAGVTAALSENFIDAGGSVTLTVKTTAATPGGNLLVAVTGTSAGLYKTTYIELALPDFALTATPNTVYLNQSGEATANVAITPENGFRGQVQLTRTGQLPEGVYGFILPPSPKVKDNLVFLALPNAETGVANPVTVTGTSAATSHIASLALSVSAALGSTGAGLPVDLSPDYNLAGLFSDGQTFANGGLDGGGYAFSSNLLTRSRVLNGVLFRFGPPNVKNVVYGTGQTIPLPSGSFDTLQLLGTGFGGNQTAQPITIHYTDGTSSEVLQSFSDWFSTTNNANEAEAVAMPYRLTALGTKDNKPFNVYAYTFVLAPGKTAKSVTLPTNRQIAILSATLANVQLGTPVNLASAFNVNAIYTDGSTFPANGGADAGGAAYSANLLGDEAGPSTLVVRQQQYRLAQANRPNAVYGNGRPITLPAGSYKTLELLGTGLQGNQTGQKIQVTYTDGTTTTITQSFSDWFQAQGYPNEYRAVRTAYRDFNDGSRDNNAFNVYRYELHLDGAKTVKSILLPENRYVIVLAMTLSNQ